MKSPPAGQSTRPSRDSLRNEARRLYLDEKLSTRSSAARMSISVPTLRKLLDEAGVPRRSISHAKAGQVPAAATIEASVRARRKHVLPGRPPVGYKLNADGYVMLRRT